MCTFRSSALSRDNDTLGDRLNAATIAPKVDHAISGEERGESSRSPRTSFVFTFLQGILSNLAFAR